MILRGHNPSFGKYPEGWKHPVFIGIIPKRVEDEKKLRKFEKEEEGLCPVCLWVLIRTRWPSAVNKEPESRMQTFPQISGSNSRGKADFSYQKVPFTPLVV